MQGRRRAKSAVGLLLGCLLVCGVALAGAAYFLLPKERLQTAPLGTLEPGPATATAAPAGPPSPATRAPRRGPSTTGYACPGFSGIQTKVPLPLVLDETFAWGNHPPAKVGDGKGNIRWDADPYKDPSWHLWLHSLRWLGNGVYGADRGNKRALDKTLAIAKDWVRDNPYPWQGASATESTMHRTNVLICIRQTTLKALKAKTLPAQHKWLDTALNDHAKFMTEHWSGIRNHGTDESIALFGIGCTYNRADLKELAVKRLNEAVVHAIDDEGTTNEQSVGYASFNYRLWGRAAEVLRACKTEPGPEIDRRREKLALWLALATKANGELHQIGNTNKQKTETAPGTPLEFVASQGKKGTKPAKRTGIYRAGYIFGRTGWGDNRPFGQESSYSIRFGFPRAYHGHEDHTAITYNWHGRDVLIDPGYLGYRKNEKQEWARTQYAHNVMTIPTAKSRNAKTKLVGAVSTPNSDYYELNDQPAEGVDRSRDVLVLKDPDLVIALDRGQSGTTQRYETLWHLPPGHQVTVDANGVAVARQPRSGMKTHLIQIPLDGAIPAGSTTVEEGRSNPAQGWFAPTIFNPVPAPVVKFTRTGQSVRILSLIIPSKEAEKVTYTTRTTGTATLVDLAVGTRKVTVKVAPFGRLTRLN